MIQVERLSKRYGPVRAVDRISFAVGQGEIVGFLGPNGAGKTTTMRILTTFLPPTSGRARVAGFDVLDDPLEVRRKVGYLPENVPLYTEMRVLEYLNFRAKLKDVPRTRRRAAIDAVIDRCGLTDVSTRILGQLSKGYRQRVGLAEAMVHDPEILILDEPTAGLDPIQIREVRSLIRELGDRHTILLSTHIMSEVEAVCGRVILIVQGKIAIDDTLEQLHAGTAIVVEARGPADAVRKALEITPGVAGVAEISRNGDSATFEIQARPGADPREALAQRLVQNGWGLRQLLQRKSSLEERFVEAVREATVATDEPTSPPDDSDPTTSATSAVPDGSSAAPQNDASGAA
ncbi:MAG TPA: ATP-binding cassette domain-containing protein [Isosphaeraceae bacterium]|jgi:ABC-2 type transport system ATP-binding protein|nr:ATP-binding cassette domain-containing protein [Isosphaeraceae bacterium]